jgi:hypothetical protein
MTRTADWRSVVQINMRAVPVVLVNPIGQCGGSLVEVLVRTSPSPLAHGDEDEAFGFAVGVP